MPSNHETFFAQVVCRCRSLGRQTVSSPDLWRAEKARQKSVCRQSELQHDRR